jgi:hypothetical protein
VKNDSKASDALFTVLEERNGKPVMPAARSMSVTGWCGSSAEGWLDDQAAGAAARRRLSAQTGPLWKGFDAMSSERRRAAAESAGGEGPAKVECDSLSEDHAFESGVLIELFHRHGTKDVTELVDPVIDAAAKSVGAKWLSVECLGAMTHWAAEKAAKRRMSLPFAREFPIVEFFNAKYEQGREG